MPDSPDGKDELRKSREQLVSFMQSLDSALDSMDGFRTSVQQLPKMTVELNRAKKGMSAALSEVIDSMNGGRNMLTDAMGVVDARLEKDQL